jgi:LuxR family maltose regulon positive regulatory protein
MTGCPRRVQGVHAAAWLPGVCTRRSACARWPCAPSSLGDRNAAAAGAEAALAAAEPDRLIFPFAMYNAAELLDVLPRHQTAHGALLADIVDLLRGAPAPRIDRERLPQPEELSPSEPRVLRFLPTNLTRPEIARSLDVSVNTVNTHIRNIYTKLGAHDRSCAVQHARQLRLLSTGRGRTSPRQGERGSVQSPDSGVAPSLGRAAR